MVLGLVGAVGAGLTGVTDWHQSDPAGARRIGLAHGLLNLTATGLYAASLILRLEGIRGPGRGLALLGYVALVAAGFLGGHLAHALRVGVNQVLEAPEEQPTPSDYVSVLAESGLGEGKLRRIEMGRIPILLTRQGDRVHALADTCSHMGAHWQRAQSRMGAWYVHATVLAFRSRMDGSSTGRPFSRNPDSQPEFAMDRLKFERRPRPGQRSSLPTGLQTEYDVKRSLPHNPRRSAMF